MIIRLDTTDFDALLDEWAENATDEFENDDWAFIDGNAPSIFIILNRLIAARTAAAPKFKVGDLVRTKNGDFVGTVVVADQADDIWGDWTYEVHCPAEGDVYIFSADELEAQP